VVEQKKGRPMNMAQMVPVSHTRVKEIALLVMTRTRLYFWLDGIAEM